MTELSKPTEVTGPVPIRPGDGYTALYRFYSRDGTLLYIGICDEPMHRWSRHSQKDWWPDVHRFRLVWIPSRAEAMKAEGEAIVSEKPVHNRAMNGVPNGGRFPAVHLHKFARDLFGDQPFCVRDLVEQLGIPPGTAGNKARELRKEGLFVELGVMTGRSGRTVQHYRALPVEEAPQ